MAASTIGRERDAAATLRRSLPVMIRETSSRSSISFACARTLRSMTSSPCADLAGVELSRARSIASSRGSPMSGVRSSCESVARNSSLSRLASRASA